MPASAKRRLGDKVAGKNNQVGLERVHCWNRGLQRVNGKNRIVMKIAEHRDLVSVDRGGPARQSEFLADQLRPVGLDQDGISCQGGSAERGREANEATASDASPNQAAFFCQDGCQRDSKTHCGYFQHIAKPRSGDIPGVIQVQKVNCAVRSTRRLAVVPGE